MEEMKKVILDKVSALENTMKKLYNIFFTMHKAFVHLYGFQQWCPKMVQTLQNIHVVIAHVQELTMRYKGAPLYLHKMMKSYSELDKEQIWMLIRNYEKLPSLITGIEASYSWLFRIFDVIVRTLNISSIRFIQSHTK